MRNLSFLLCMLIAALLLSSLQALSTEDPSTDDPGAVPSPQELADTTSPPDTAATLPFEGLTDPVSSEDPAADLPSHEDPSEEMTRYTLEEFDALSDEAQRDVYLNYPEQLPADFDVRAYVDSVSQDEGPEN